MNKFSVSLPFRESSSSLTRAAAPSPSFEGEASLAQDQPWASPDLQAWKSKG
jgi:hypothetical protein